MTPLEELLDTIDMNQMSALDIEPTGFQALGHRFNGLSFFVGRVGFFQASEGYGNLRFKFADLVLDYGAGQVVELFTETIDAMPDAFLSMLEISEDKLSRNLFSCPGISLPEVVTDADMVLDGVYNREMKALKLKGCYMNHPTRMKEGKKNVKSYADGRCRIQHEALDELNLPCVLYLLVKDAGRTSRGSDICKRKQKCLPIFDSRRDCVEMGLAGLTNYNKDE